MQREENGQLLLSMYSAGVTHSSCDVHAAPTLPSEKEDAEDAGEAGAGAGVVAGAQLARVRVQISASGRWCFIGKKIP